MHPSILNYTIGSYNEYPEGSISVSGSALLAESLAWAVQSDIPFHEVISSMMQNGRLSFNRQIFLLPRSKKWEKCLCASYSDLLKGVPLHTTLRKRFSYFLPEYYLRSIEKAEKEGRLKEILPVFARRLNRAAETRKYYKRTMLLPFVEFIIIYSVLLPVSIFIFPNLQAIFSDVTGQNVQLSWITLFLTQLNTTFSIMASFMFYAFLFYLLGRIFPSAHRFVVMLIEEILIFIPPFKKQLKDIAFLELSSSMASYLDSGEDILNAARFSKSSCSHFWLRKKLKKFIRKIENGTNWLDAWASMRLGQNVGESIIRNSVARENIASGFDTVSDWLYHKHISTMKKNAILFFVSGVAFNSAIVFLIVLYVFQLLIDIINYV